MSELISIKIGEIRLLVNDTVIYKPIYEKNILKVFLARVDGKSDILIKCNSRRHLEKVVELLDSLTNVRSVEDDFMSDAGTEDVLDESEYKKESNFIRRILNDIKEEIKYYINNFKNK